MLIIVLEFLLGINVLKQLGGVPPLSIGLDHNSIRLNLLNQLLSSLGEHRGLVWRTHQIHFFTIESFGEMNHSSLKAVDSIQIILKLQKHYVNKTYLSPFLSLALPLEFAALTKTCLGIVLALSGLTNFSAKAAYLPIRLAIVFYLFNKIN
jgi:hypothetical protein